MIDILLLISLACHCSSTILLLTIGLMSINDKRVDECLIFSLLIISIVGLLSSFYLSLPLFFGY